MGRSRVACGWVLSTRAGSSEKWAAVPGGYRQKESQILDSGRSARSQAWRRRHQAARVRIVLAARRLTGADSDADGGSAAVNQRQGDNDRRVEVERWAA